MPKSATAAAKPSSGDGVRSDAILQTIIFRRIIQPRTLALALFAAIAVAGYLAVSVFGDVYSGVPASIPSAEPLVHCSDERGGSCDAHVVRLNPGRFYIRTAQPSSYLSIQTQDVAAVARARVLLVRTQNPGRLLFLGGNPGGAPDVDIAAGGKRVLIPVHAGPTWNEIRFSSTTTGKPLEISEFGLFETDHGLIRSTRQPFPWLNPQRYYTTYTVAVLYAIFAFVVFAAWDAPDLMRRAGPWVLAALCGSVCILELGTTFSPYWSRDIREIYGAELVESGSNGNLTGSLYVGSRLLQGLGATEPPGIVQWHRMPGYGLFCGLAAAIGRTTDVVEIAMTVIVLQVLLYTVSVGTFVAAAARVFAPWLACLLGVLVTLLPKQLHYTQVDSIATPIALLVAAALLMHLAATRVGEPWPFHTFLLVNLAFAFWFFMRNDVLPGWVIVSLMLVAPRWRFLAVPLLLMLAVAVPWGLYKQRYTHEFSPLPTNTGEVLFLGLCEVPGRFPYLCTDAGYFEWVQRAIGRNPTSRHASDAAAAEVVRHWVTYPIHFVFMVLTKFRRCVSDHSWLGIHTRFSWLYTIVREADAFLFLLAAVAVAVAVDHERRRSLLLGWAMFFNMPLFFVAFESAGRFYAAAGAAAVVAAVPLLVEPGFYRHVVRRRRRAAIVLACVAALVVGGRWFEGFVETHDGLHYWAPLLDPRGSTLAFPHRDLER
jgi:hypothetical protein